MNGFKTQLDRLESRLQSLIERSTARLFPAYEMQLDLGHLLVQAMREALHEMPNGAIMPPNHFIIYVHPAQKQALLENPELLDDLRNILLQAGEDTGVIFLTSPDITLISNPGMQVGEMRISAEHAVNEPPDSRLSETTNYRLENAEKPAQLLPKNAFLIVDGTSVFHLTQGVVNIGRMPDNDLVIDDPRVSRRHAQVRVIDGRYTIFDLESTGGTWVNNKRIQKRTLQPGDVISLSGLPLVYGHDASVGGDTQKYVLDSTGRLNSASNPSDVGKGEEASK